MFLKNGKPVEKWIANAAKAVMASTLALMLVASVAFALVKVWHNGSAIEMIGWVVVIFSFLFAFGYLLIFAMEWIYKRIYSLTSMYALVTRLKELERKLDEDAFRM